MAHSTRDASGKFASTNWESSLDTSEMQWTVVNSSNVAAVGYNDGTSTLGVTFLNGSSYEYYNVPRDVYDALVSASSVGKYLHYAVKGQFAYERTA